MHSLLENDVVSSIVGAASLARELFTDFIFSSLQCCKHCAPRGLNSSSPVEKNSFFCIDGQGFNVICQLYQSCFEQAGSIFKLASLKFVPVLFPIFY